MLRELSMVAVLMAAAVFPSTAQDAPVVVGQPDLAACAAVAMDPVDIGNKLLAFEDAFGKNALNWHDEDYEQLFALVEACDQVQIDGRVVTAAVWRSIIDNARVKIYPLAETHRQVMERAARPGSNDIPMPDCINLAKFTREADISVDSAAEIFGKPFLAFTDDELRHVIDHSNQCLAFLPEFMLMKFGAPPDVTTKILYEMMDRALLIQAHREDWKYWQGRAATDVKIAIDGVEIIPTLASLEAQRLVKRYNQAAKFPGGLSTQTISLLISLSDKVLEDEASGEIDKAFASEVKGLVQKDIFERTDFKLEPAMP